MKHVDVLAIAAHPDDVELICGGTLIRAQMLGRKTGILDLAAGELASRGSPELRAKEAAKAAKVMGVSVRENLGLPDGGIQNTPETRAKVAVGIRIIQSSPSSCAMRASWRDSRRSNRRYQLIVRSRSFTLYRFERTTRS